jgi:hypothetical protein
MMTPEKAYKLIKTMMSIMDGRPIKISGIKYTMEIRSNDIKITEIKNRSILERNFIICSSPLICYFLTFSVMTCLFGMNKLVHPGNPCVYENARIFLNALGISIECSILLFYHYHPILLRDSKVFYQDVAVTLSSAKPSSSGLSFEVCGRERKVLFKIHTREINKIPPALPMYTVVLLNISAR